MKKEENQFNQNNPWWKPAMFFYAKVTSWIIFPILISVLLSKYFLDNNQILFFVLIVLSFGLTCFGIYKEIKIYKRDIDKNDNK
ncbi:MAG: hypothetical protein AAB438_00165 [Patescibacteria group bacterium]